MKRFSTAFAVLCMALSMWAAPIRNSRTALSLPQSVLPALFDVQPTRAAHADDDNTIRMQTAAIVWQRHNNAWYVGAIDSDSTTVFYFYYESPTLTGTFSLAQLNTTYSYIEDHTSGNKVQYPYTDATLSLTQDAQGVSLSADLQANGKHYMLTGFQKAVMPKDTVTYIFPQTNLQKGYMSVVIDGEIEGEVIASALIYTTNIVGSYTSEDFEMVYSTFVRFPNKPNEKDSTFVDAMDCSAEVSVEDGAYHFDISMLGKDTILYRLHLYHPITVTDTIDIAINNLSIDLSAVEYMNTFFLDGSNNDYTVTIACEGTGADGIYEGAQTATATITDANGTTIRSVNTKLTLYTVGGVREADAEVYGNDDKFYRIHLVFSIPEPKQTVEITFDTPGEGIYYREDGSFYMYNQDTRYIVALEVYTDQPEGEYQREDFRPRYTYIGVISGADTTGVAMYTASANITRRGDQYAIDANILGTDTVLYHIQMLVNYRYIAIQYDMQSGEFVQDYTDADQVSFNTRYFPTSGYVAFTALSQSGKLTYLEFYPDSLDRSTTLPVGTYPINSTENAGTVYAGQGVLNNSIVGSVCGNYTQQGMNVPCFFVATGNVVVEVADGQLVLTMEAQNTNGRPIKVVYKSTTPLTALKDISAEQPAAHKIIHDGQVYILINSNTYTPSGQHLNP